MLTRRAKALHGPVYDAIRRTGAEVAEELSARTFPSENAIGITVKAVRFDVSLVYCTGGKAYEILAGHSGKPLAGKFYHLYKSGDLSAARAVLRASGSPIASIILGTPLQPALHESVRNKEGRVIAAYPLQICPAEEIAAHSKIVIAEIGKTAAGWSACAEKLGGDGNAIRWKGTGVHGSAAGDVQWIEDEFGVHLILENNSHLAKKHISPGQVAAIMEPARERLRERLKQSITAAA